jgi:transposase InsO family protein
MKSLRVNYSLKELCHALGVSRSGYLAWKSRPPSARQLANAQLLNQMRVIHAHRHTRCYGSPRMTRELQARGWYCSEKRVARLMRQSGLRARPRRPFRPKTTTPDHAAAPSPNLLARAGAAQAPSQHLLSDITYIPTAQGWLYLAVVIDRFSRLVLGWKLSNSLHSNIATTALDKALATGLVAPGSLFHSDRGCQYTAGQFRKRLVEAKLVQSMSAKGYCYDNAMAESFFACFKNEALPENGRFESHRAASRAVFDYIECFYNRHRRHTALGGIPPLTFLNHFFQNQQPLPN